MLSDGNANIAKNANIANSRTRIGLIRRGMVDARSSGMPDTRDQSELPSALKARTKRFALGVMVASRQFPQSIDGAVVAKQLIKAATAVAANYRAACRARSPAEFTAKIGVVAEEADESELWLELTVEGGLLQGQKVTELLREAGELTAIFTASRDTAKKNLERGRAREPSRPR